MGVRHCSTILTALLLGATGLAAPAAADERQAPPAAQEQASPQPLMAVADVDPVDELQQALGVTDAYWQAHFTVSFGGTYTPPTLLVGADGIPGYFDADYDVAACGSEIVGGEPARRNAFYCPPGDWLTIESDLLAESVALGDSLIHLAAAHEWGHAIQARLAPEALWPALELQADCFAGASLGGAAQDGTLLWEEGDTEELAASLAAAADDAPWADVADHGSPEERLAAFDRGFAGGPLGCLPDEVEMEAEVETEAEVAP